MIPSRITHILQGSVWSPRFPVNRSERLERLTRPSHDPLPKKPGIYRIQKEFAMKEPTDPYLFIHAPAHVRHILEYPVADGGVALQTLARRHARLLIHLNIWRRPITRKVRIRENEQCKQYALAMYCRLVRRTGAQVPLPPLQPDQSLDRVWTGMASVCIGERWETQEETLARVIYLAAFVHELVWYSDNYVLAHVARWNQCIQAASEQGKLRLDEHRTEGVLDDTETSS